MTERETQLKPREWEKTAGKGTDILIDYREEGYQSASMSLASTILMQNCSSVKSDVACVNQCQIINAS